MAGFSDNDIEKSSWAVGKAWARDTLAYRGNNVWKCFSVQDKREGQGEMKEVQSVYKERRHSSHQFLLWTIQKGGHSETMFVLDSFAKKRKKKKELSYNQSDVSTPHFCVISVYTSQLLMQ